MLLIRKKKIPGKLIKRLKTKAKKKRLVSGLLFYSKRKGRYLLRLKTGPAKIKKGLKTFFGRLVALLKKAQVLEKDPAALNTGAASLNPESGKAASINAKNDAKIDALIAKSDPFKQIKTDHETTERAPTPQKRLTKDAQPLTTTPKADGAQNSVQSNAKSSHLQKTLGDLEAMSPSQFINDIPDWLKLQTADNKDAKQKEKGLPAIDGSVHGRKDLAAPSVESVDHAFRPDKLDKQPKFDMKPAMPKRPPTMP